MSRRAASQPREPAEAPTGASAGASAIGPAAPARDRRLPLLAVGLVLLPFALLVWRFDFVCDDAYISFRYAKNLAAGHGLRFNLGDHRPVEGYSNFLWTLWAAVFELAGMPTAVWLRVTSVACGAALVAWVTAFARRHYELGLAGTVATGLVVATLPPLVVWSTGGLATVPATLCIFGCFERLLGDRSRPRGLAAGLLGLGASLLRADGAAWVLLVLVVGGLAWLVRRDRRLLVATLVAALVLVAGTAVHVLWRHGYYGDWLPNTARIKAGFSLMRLQRGFDYLMVLLLSFPSLVAAVGLGLAALARRREVAGLAALAMVAATSGYAVYVGGDFMAMGRFVVPMMPFVALLFAAAWARWGERRLGPVPLGSLAAAVVVLLSLLPCYDRYVFPRAVRERFHFRLANPEHWSEYRMWRQMRVNADKWARQGRMLALTTAPGESMILGPIGAIGYYSDLFLYDTYGLTSRAVTLENLPPRKSSPGHDKEVPVHFFFEFRPTYLGYALAPAGTPPDTRLLQQWSEYGDRIRIDVRPVPPGVGMDTTKDLWLLRLRRED